MGYLDDTHKRMAIKALKIAVGCCGAILLGEIFHLKNTASAGIVTLLTVQDTRKDTIRLIVDRFLSFVMSIVLILLCFHMPGSEWIHFTVYIFLMLIFSYVMEWQGTISVNAVIGTHFLISGDFSRPFILNEFLLVVLGTLIALVLNWKMPSHRKHIREAIHKIENGFQQVLRGFALHLRGEQSEVDVWQRLDQVEECLHQNLVRAREQAGNTTSRMDAYYVEYLEMRLAQCMMLQTLGTWVRKIRVMPSQAGMISEYLEYLAGYLHEREVPEEETQKLQEIFERMKKEPMPVTRGEFENRALLYHVLMDLEEFLAVKQHFLDTCGPRPDEL